MLLFLVKTMFKALKLQKLSRGIRLKGAWASYRLKTFFRESLQILLSLLLALLVSPDY